VITIQVTSFGHSFKLKSMNADDASPLLNQQQPRPVSPFPTTSISTAPYPSGSDNLDHQLTSVYQSLSLLSATSEPFKSSSPLLLLVPSSSSSSSSSSSAPQAAILPLLPPQEIPLLPLAPAARAWQKKKKQPFVPRAYDVKLRFTPFLEPLEFLEAHENMQKLLLDRSLIAALPKGVSKATKRGILLAAYKLEAAVRKHVDTVQGANLTRMPRLRSSIFQAFLAATHFSRLNGDQVLIRLSPHLNEAAKNASAPESAAVLRAVARGELVPHSTRADVAHDLHEGFSFAVMAAFSLRVITVCDFKGARIALEEARNAASGVQNNIILFYAGGSRYGAITFLKAASAARAAEARAKRDAEEVAKRDAEEVAAAVEVVTEAVESYSCEPMSRAALELHNVKEFANANRSGLVTLVHSLTESPALMSTVHTSLSETPVLTTTPPTQMLSMIASANETISKPIPSTESLERLISRPRVGVGCILLSHAHPGSILVGERKGSHGSGRWALPGGHLEKNQSWGECASMELEEECGVEIATNAWKFISVTNDVMEEEGLHYITLFVAATVSDAALASLENREPDKCVGWEWLTIEELRSKPIFIPLKHLLQDEAAVNLLMQSRS
jgi:8-oxo-dGTP diphosphatase